MCQNSLRTFNMETSETIRFIRFENDDLMDKKKLKKHFIMYLFNKTVHIGLIQIDCLQNINNCTNVCIDENVHENVLCTVAQAHFLIRLLFNQCDSIVICCARALVYSRVHFKLHIGSTLSVRYVVACATAPGQLSNQPSESNSLLDYTL